MDEDLLPRNVCRFFVETGWKQMAIKKQKTQNISPEDSASLAHNLTDNDYTL